MSHFSGFLSSLRPSLIIVGEIIIIGEMIIDGGRIKVKVPCLQLIDFLVTKLVMDEMITINKGYNLVFGDSCNLV